MSVQGLKQGFADLKVIRRTMPEESLLRIGKLASLALADLADDTNCHIIPWEGGGDKTYKVFARADDQRSWSRAVNTRLFIDSPAEFDALFQTFAGQITAARGQLQAASLTADQVDRATYTTIMSFAAATGLYDLGRGMAGTFFEMTVGALLSLLTGRTETGDVVIPIPNTKQSEIVKVDLTFDDPHGGVSLAVPTKISTRERISQAFVHARILAAARPDSYLNILCVVNENNAFHRVGAPKNLASLLLRDTLVPGTIALYQRYVAELDGLYYLDPPPQYLAAQRAGLPPVRHFSSLLLGDLAELLA